MICNPYSKQDRDRKGFVYLPSNIHKIHTGQWTPLTMKVSFIIPMKVWICCVILTDFLNLS
jgi:hypothetical protein